MMAKPSNIYKTKISKYIDTNGIALKEIIRRRALMPGTFSQIYIHVVFAVKNRNCLIKPEWEDRLYKYITGIVQNKGQKMLAINGTANHIHFCIGMKHSCCLSDLVREVKKASNEFVNTEKFTK